MGEWRGEWSMKEKNNNTGICEYSVAPGLKPILCARPIEGSQDEQFMKMHREGKER